MRILLIGDFSEAFKNLKEGLVKLGYDASIATVRGGSEETTKTDIYMPDYTNIKIEQIKNLFDQIDSYYNYDIVQIMHDDVFWGRNYNYNYEKLKRIKRSTGKMFFCSAGTSPSVYNATKKQRYNHLEEYVEIDLKGLNPFIDKRNIKNNIDVVSVVDGIIPITYTYAEAYRDNEKLLNTIPLPINTDKIKFIPQEIKDNKLKIFHGISREGFKGTKYIKEAMLRIKEKYPNDVEILINGNMPLKEYLKVLKETNIVIDQALSYEYGMNALYAMAMGKVVLSGNEPECQKQFGRNDIPVINILPSADDIYNKLEKLVLNKKSVEEIGYKSRKFVEDFHNHVKVAQKYIDTWNSCEVKSYEHTT